MTTDTATESKARKSASDGFISADSDNVTLFPQQVVDNMMHVLIDLGAELWAVRRRMAILERVLEKVGVSSNDVEVYVPSAEDQAAWRQERDIYISRAFGAMTRKGGANEKQMDTSKM